jgi:hypothetical protein
MEAINKEGRHVGLDFYDLLIEGDYTHDPVRASAMLGSHCGIGGSAVEPLARIKDFALSISASNRPF